MALHFFPDSQNYIEFIDWQGTVACYKIQHLKALKNRETYESYHHTFRKLLSCREWQEWQEYQKSIAGTRSNLGQIMGHIINFAGLRIISIAS